VPAVLGIASLNFVLVHLAPGDAADVLAGSTSHATPQYVEELRRGFGLDRPLWEQFGIFLWRLVRLDLGYSFAQRASVGRCCS
jgi:peptide/nickel transport system permease protein